MPAVPNSNKRLIALANMAIRSFIVSLRPEKMTTELRDRALKPDEAFVTPDQLEATVHFSVNKADTCEITIEVRGNSVHVYGRLVYPLGGSRLLRDGSQDSCVIDAQGRLAKASDDLIRHELVAKMKRLYADTRLKNSRAGLSVLDLSTPRSEAIAA